MAELSFNSKRVIVGIALVPCLLCIANYWFDLGIFGRFGKGAVALSALVLALAIHFSGVTLQEIQEYRDSKRKQDGLGPEK